MSPRPQAFPTRPHLGLFLWFPHAAWERVRQELDIAERGPMRLHLADIHLHRARLFRDQLARNAARRA